MTWVGTYILDDNGEPVPVDTITWARWFEADEHRIVRQDHVDGVLVSTIFSGLDTFSFSEQQHEPFLWETMIFGGEHDRYQRRYSSLADAEKGHLEALALLDGWSKEIRELEKIFATQDFWTKK